MKPYISTKNKMSQLKFVTEHYIWTKEQWDCVYFSNESKFDCNRRRFVQRSPKEQYSPQWVRFGGGRMMMFVMISAAGTGPLVRLLCKINTTVYKEILKKHVVPNLRTAISQPAVFMQDNAPCHADISFWGGCCCYGVACSKPRHESYWECLEVTKRKS